MKFSIIIPMYNVEKYIAKCLDSILNQTCKDYEIIIVNDGSKDKSGEICDNYAKKHEHIKVIHIENGGVSNARNVGIRHASGEYFWFIDSDDYIDADTLENIAYHLDRFSYPDLMVFDAEVMDEQGNKIGEISCNIPTETALSFDKCRELVFANTSLWNRIYKSSIIRANDLAFETGISIAEDLLFNYTYLSYAEQFYYVKVPVYHYIQRQNSAMSGAGKNKDVEKAFDRLFDCYKKENKYELYKQELEYLALYHYFLTTSVRMIRCSEKKEDILNVRKWFEKHNIKITLNNPYIRKMASKHILVFLLLKLKAYGIVAMLFSKFK